MDISKKKLMLIQVIQLSNVLHVIQELINVKDLIKIFHVYLDFISLQMIQLNPIYNNSNFNKQFKMYHL